MKNELIYKEDSDFEIPFWKEWLEADYLEK